MQLLKLKWDESAWELEFEIQEAMDDPNLKYLNLDPVDLPRYSVAPAVVETAVATLAMFPPTRPGEAASTNLNLAARVAVLSPAGWRRLGHCWQLKWSQGPRSQCLLRTPPECVSNPTREVPLRLHAVPSSQER